MQPLETNIKTIPAIIFVDITGRNVYNFTPELELKELERIASEQFTFEQRGNMHPKSYIINAAYYN